MMQAAGRYRDRGTEGQRDRRTDARGHRNRGKLKNRKHQKNQQLDTTGQDGHQMKCRSAG
jgi:hypothetical protein